jgi:hypothetical protein
VRGDVDGLGEAGFRLLLDGGSCGSLPASAP